MVVIVARMKTSGLSWQGELESASKRPRKLPKLLEAACVVDDDGCRRACKRLRPTSCDICDVA